MLDAQDFFGTLLQTSTDALLVTSFEAGEIVEVSNSFCVLSGYHRDELLGRRLSTLALFDPPLECGLSRSGGSSAGADNGAPAGDPNATVGMRETQLRHRDGSERCVEYSHQRADRSHVLTIARDVTARRAADLRLQESAERFRISFESAPIGKSLFGIDGGYLMVNQAFATLTGYRKDELHTLSIRDTTHPDDLAADLDGMARLLAGEVETYSLEKRYLTPTGGEVWAAKTAALVHDRAGSPLYFIGQVQDITARKRQEHLLAEERRRLRESQSVGRLGSWELDLSTTTVSLSDGLLDVLGLDLELDGNDLDEVLHIVHSDDRATVRESLVSCADTGVPLRLRCRIHRRTDGQLRWIDATGERLVEDGTPVRLTGTIVDVTEAVLAAEAKLSQDAVVLVERRSARYQEALLSALVQGLMVVDTQGRVVSANAAAHQLLGLHTDNDTGRITLRRDRQVVDEFGDPMPSARRPAIRALSEGSTVRDAMLGIVHPAGRTSWFDITAVPVPGDDDRPEAVVVGISDVTDDRRSKQALADSEEQFRLAFESAPVGMAMLDLARRRRGRVLRANNALGGFTGRTPAELRRLDLDAICDPSEVDANREILVRLCVDGADAAPVEKRFRRRDGSTAHGLLSMSFIPASQDRPAYALCLIQDITARKQAEAALLHQSLHDPLTGLPNRNLLYDRIDHALDAARRTGIPVGLLFVDLDGFKQVNDISGHAAGDELLVEAAARIRHSVRPGDTVARLGGDEFAVVCIGIATLDDLRGIAVRVLGGLRSPFRLASSTHQISASVGMELATGTDDPEHLLATADAAMYRAKSVGGDRIGSPRPEERARAAQAGRLGPELHRALRENEFVMYGQPVLDIGSGRPIAVECLVRWFHPVRGVLPPGEFLPTAERGPMMAAIGRRVLDESCRMGAVWRSRFGSAAPSVHVNVSGRQLESGDLVADVLAALAEHSLPADRLVLELTETYVPSIADTLRSDLGELRERGVRIAIDDIGTGYSSLARITELPVDMLKIDLTFVAGLGVDRACDAVVRAVLSLGKTMGLTVVAEGVESAQQAELLRMYGCDTVQGFLYSAPLPEAELMAYLAGFHD